MLKKILKQSISFVLFLTVLSALFMVVATAVSSENDKLLQELSTLKIGEDAFSKEKYPKDNTQTSLLLLTAAERNFRTNANSPEYAFELYFYNPAGIVVTNSSVNRLSMAFDMDSDEYQFYYMDLVSKTDDNLFLKFRLRGSVTDLYKKQPSTDCRIYNLVSVQVVVGGILQTYDISKAYVYSGYDFNNTLSCREDDLETIKTTLHSSVWRSQYNIKDDPYTFEQIATAYFTIPRSFLTKYGELYSLKSTYDEYRSSPVIVTNSADFNGRTELVNALQSGGSAPSGTTLTYGYKYVSQNMVMYDWAYGLKPYVSGNFQCGVRKVCDAIYYYFYAPELSFIGNSDSKRLYSAVSSAEFARYVSEHSGGSKVTVNENLYESATIGKVLDTNKDDLYKQLTKTYREGNFWQKLFGKHYISTSEGSVQIPQIQVVENPADYTYATTSQMEELYLNVNDTTEFRDVCKEAAENDCVVVCYHFAESDYQVHELKVSPGLSDKDNDHSTWMAQQTFYYNFSLISATFHRNGAYHTVPVSSNSINVIGGIDVTEPEDELFSLSDDFKEFLEKLLEILKVIGIILAAVLVVFVVVQFVIPLLSPVVKTIGAVVSAPFKAASKRKERRETRKNKKE